MSRRRLPRRFPLAFALWSLAMLALSPQALGQSATMRLNGDRSNADACAAYAAANNAPDEAIAACTRALEAEHLDQPSSITTHINRGNLYLRRNDPQPAIADFDAVIAADRRNAEARLDRGVALMMQGQPGPAVAVITEALTLGVHEPQKAYYDRAAAREALGDLRGAYEDYSTALQIAPDWGPANAEMQRLAEQRKQMLATALNDEPGH